MSFRVSVTPVDLQFEVDDGETILSAAIRQGVGLPYGCRDGACGSCKCTLVEGRVTHRPHQPQALTPEEKHSGRILACCAVPASDCTVQARGVCAAGDFPVIKMPTRVLSLARPTADVALLRLQLPGNQSFRYHAGQYIEFLLRDGQRRSYSMANAPTRLGTPPSIELHLRHMPGGLFTDHVFGAMKDKDILRTEGPLGGFRLNEASTAPIVLLASGTGLAPIKAIIEHMQDQGIARDATLYWGCRSRADLSPHVGGGPPAAALPWLRYVPVLSEPRPDDGWTGRTGFVHEAVMTDHPDLSAHEVYACGVPVMVEAARRDFTSRCGLTPSAFHSDAFSSAADRASVS
jgi:CDP-4-dehydro-6-deoxyglucose reductase